MALLNKRDVALVFLIGVVFLSCRVSYATETDVYCLKTLKESLEDPLNYLNYTWDFGNTTEGFICKFAGIDCWHPEENRVLNIRLSDIGLKGQFPRGLENCSSLTGLDLSNNKLSGPIPSNISDMIGFITSLDLSSNRFSGEIPVSIANLSYLNILKLNNNQLTGSIPLQLGLLGRIKTFSVANNLLTGPVPQFANAAINSDSYANNSGLCGKPLDPCQASPSKIHTGV